MRSTSVSVKLCVAALAVAWLLTGCTSALHKRRLNSYNTLYNKGNYAEAAKADGLKDEDLAKPDSGKLLEYLQAGVALRYAGDYESSCKYFDAGETLIKAHNDTLMVEDAGKNVGAVLLNDAVMDYSGEEYDGIMVNTYKAMNFWQAGKMSLARVEFNRALDRQRRAKERFAAEIAKLQKEMDEKEAAENKKLKAKSAKAQGMDIRKNVENPEVEEILKDKYASLYAFKPYPDFINPFTTYMAGLFFLSQNDHAKAVTLLKEAYGMMSDHPGVAADFAVADGSMKQKSPCVWVVFENGLGPEKEELRIDLPLFVATSQVDYTAIALPKLVMRDAAYSELMVKDGTDHLLGRTSSLASMDRVVQTEFKKKYPMVLTRAIVSTLVKTTIQYVAKKKMGDLAGLAAAIIQGATTSADVRIWTGLPKEFQMARISAPKDGKLVIETPGGQKLPLEVPQGRNALVYVKIPQSDAPIYHGVIAM